MRADSPDPPGPPGASPPGDSEAAREVLRRVFALLEDMESAQRGKVIALARRLVHLTAEDIRNPHDFPDLDDPDWHFEDGQLAGVQSVVFALRRLASDLLPDELDVEEREAREGREGVAPPDGAGRREGGRGGAEGGG